jgi:hypothetical protein
VLVRALLAALTALPLLVGCAGTSCEDLPALRAERDAARQDYAVLTAPGTAPPEVTGPADEDLHALERRVHDAEQRCEDR